MAITYEDLVATSRRLSGQKIRTAGGRASFRVEVLPGRSGDVVVVRPTSTDEPRRLGATTRKVLAQYNETGPTRFADYRGMTYNASYVLALIKLVA